MQKYCKTWCRVCTMCIGQHECYINTPQGRENKLELVDSTQDHEGDGPGAPLRECGTLIYFNLYMRLKLKKKTYK